MKVLVLGGTGVIGGPLCRLLAEQGHQVTALHGGRRAVPPGCVGFVGMDAGEETLNRLASLGKFDAVIDLLCFTPRDAKILLEVFAKRTDQIIICSSVAAYERPYEHQPVQPDNPLMKENIFPYGFQKAEMERYVRGWMKEGYPVTILRPSQTWWIGTPNIGVLRSNYGVIRRILRGKPLIVNGDGKNSWVWTFSPDLAKAFAGMLGNERCLGECYHATSDETHIWDDLYLTLGRICGNANITGHGKLQA
ncbi:MAG: NAD-dependent epimerase/dehydratase family protein, partial [Clostridia bacterium]|nr:NAD-dependent epimerase/dehydratase family protein [Clostridia bacterium]